MRETTCRSCAAAVLMVPTKASNGDRQMPLDKEPSEKGNAMILPDGMVTVLGGALLDKARVEGTVLRTSHHFTCPQGERWRRKRRG